MKNKTTHTPGPWSKESPNQDIKAGIGCIFRACLEYPYEEREANARLIAAAPDMYEELCRIRDTGRIDQDSLSVIIAKAKAV